MVQDLESGLNSGEYEIPPSDTIVLVIDDEPAILTTLQKVLAREGYIVLTAESAELGLDIMESDYRPHVVLTDKNLPGLDGLELIRRGKVLCPDVEFIVMTGYASIESSIMAVELGAAAFIQKPFDLKVMIRHVKSALAKHVAALQNRDLVDRIAKIRSLQSSLQAERDVLKGFVEQNLSNLLVDMKALMVGSENADERLQKANDALESFLETHRGLLRSGSSDAT